MKFNTGDRVRVRETELTTANSEQLYPGSEGTVVGKGNQYITVLIDNVREDDEMGRTLIENNGGWPYLPDELEAVDVPVTAAEKAETHTLRAGIYRDKRAHDLKILVVPAAEPERYDVVYVEDNDVTELGVNVIARYYELESGTPKFAVGEKVGISNYAGYLGLGPQGIVLKNDAGPNPSYPYRVVVVQPDGTVDVLSFAEDELEAI